MPVGVLQNICSGNVLCFFFEQNSMLPTYSSKELQTDVFELWKLIFERHKTLKQLSGSCLKLQRSHCKKLWRNCTKNEGQPYVGDKEKKCF